MSRFIKFSFLREQQHLERGVGCWHASAERNLARGEVCPAPEVSLQSVLVTEK